MNKINFLAVHCSDSPDDREVDAAEIHRWHRERGWSGIGYHAVIQRDGTVENGRPHYWKGAHVKNHNAHSIGVCLIGRMNFTPPQYAALAALLKEWTSSHPGAKVVGHCDLDSRKTCPNFDVTEWWSWQCQTP